MRKSCLCTIQLILNNICIDIICVCVVDILTYTIIELLFHTNLVIYSFFKNMAVFF